MQTSARGAASRVFDACNYGMLAVAGFLFFYPFWSLLLASFSDSMEIQHVGLKFWNATWTIEPYRWVLEAQSVSIGKAYYNSVFRTVLGTGAILVVTFLTAYPLAKVRLPGRTPIMLYFVIILFFSGGLIPTYLLVRRLGLIDTRLVYILPEALSVWYVIIARNFLMAMDDEMEEAALVDGAGYLTILTRIVMPLAKPIVATIALWASVMHWNAWFDALIYIRDGEKAGAAAPAAQDDEPAAQFRGIRGAEHTDGDHASARIRAGGHRAGNHRSDHPGVSVLSTILRQGHHDRGAQIGRVGPMR